MSNLFQNPAERDPVADDNDIRIQKIHDCLSLIESYAESIHTNPSETDNAITNIKLFGEELERHYMLLIDRRMNAVKNAMNVAASAITKYREVCDAFDIYSSSSMYQHIGIDNSGYEFYEINPVHEDPENAFRLTDIPDNVNDFVEVILKGEIAQAETYRRVPNDVRYAITASIEAMLKLCRDFRDPLVFSEEKWELPSLKQCIKDRHQELENDKSSAFALTLFTRATKTNIETACDIMSRFNTANPVI